jgi:polysaccharide biosynthesis protein PslE
MITHNKPEVSVTKRDICRLLFRHKKKVVFCFSLCICAAVAIILFWPRKYRSESKLLVRLGRETVTLDPTATTGQVMSVSVSREAEVSSVLEMLRSRVMIEKLVDDLGTEAILSPTAATAAPNAKDAKAPIARFNLRSWINLDPISEREKAINNVAQCLDSTIEKKSDVITISGIADSPQLAQEIVSKFVHIYLGEHARLHRTAGSEAFFTEQTDLFRKHLADALTKLRDAKNSMGMVNVDNQQIILQREIIDTENRLAQSSAALAASRKRAAAIRQGFEALPERLATDEIKGFPNAAADSMRQDLYHLEIREAELASRFTDDFPALVAVRQQIKNAKAPLTKEEQRRTQSTTTVSTVHNQLKLNLLTEDANIESLTAQTAALDAQLTKLRQRVNTLNENEPQIAKLEQEVALCKANYKTYCEKSEQSRIDNALQNERITNVNVIQPASLVVSPVSPRKTSVLTFGLLGGIVLGIGAALIAEYLDPSLKTPGEVEDRLLLPVLMAIPRVSQRHTVLK